ncbi:hypothetical protein OEA41_008890 [Lepraria neglecta]|uniref:G domain-containing protein n=1 Tax=Lepraria neglecta TaxID=209136 RepID=A0AAD9Z293_9LECA|nr:hypothetical protein OEA41_008890 [Lepraria neglecta]
MTIKTGRPYDQEDVLTAPPRYSEDVAAEECNSYESEKQDEPKEDLPINVLVVGETQNGKSTMIRQMGVYAGVPDINVKIRFGNVSCTRNVGQYDISTALRRYYLTDLNGKGIKKKDYSDLVDLMNDDAKVVAATPEDGGKVVKLTFFDTPGLDDSDGNDMEIMANIVGKTDGTSPESKIVKPEIRNATIPYGPVSGTATSLPAPGQAQRQDATAQVEEPEWEIIEILDKKETVSGTAYKRLIMTITNCTLIVQPLTHP